MPADVMNTAVHIFKLDGKQPFVGLRVLAVEDEPVLLMALEDVLADLGCDVVATATSVADALRFVEGGDFEVAIVDVTLGKDKIDSVVRALASRNLPVIFATGHGVSEVKQRFGAGAVMLQKPFSVGALTGALTTVLAR
jgi:CheY-like chemotaxis protein